ncbi:neurotensin receptor type 2 [Latimeria chalumnae]|uniref:neurotensin receptor type 2 n=1 Tax=Latimeria chalumnae TaxID=7897 RepID=UPI0003C114E5
MKSKDDTGLNQTFDLGSDDQNSLPSGSNLSSVVPNATLSLEDQLGVNTHLSSKVLFTVVYTLIFFVGTIGNSLTIYLVLKKKSLQNLQSTVHYHLVSLALSDLLILIISVPIELYNFVWVHYPWIFGDLVCRGYYFLRDICSYATVLNIVSLSFERYLAISNPIRAKRIISKKRTKTLLSLIWLSSIGFALPMAFVMGEKYQLETAQGVPNPSSRVCTALVSNATLKVFIQVNAFVSFLLPLSLISVMNFVIANRLMAFCKGNSQNILIDFIPDRWNSLTVSNEPNQIQALKHSVHVLRAIVIAYVMCWLPYHARRLMFCYVPGHAWTDSLYNFYHYFYMLTNTLFYVSSAVNPILYNVVSSTFRRLFFQTLGYLCRKKTQTIKLPLATRSSHSIKSNLTTISTTQIIETIY